MIPSTLAQGAPKVLLYYSNAPSVRDVFREERPNLQALLRESGVALMTTGPTRTDPYVSLRTGRYVPVEEAGDAEPRYFPDGVLHLIEPRRDPRLGDRMLGDLRRRYPDVPVVAVHPAPWRPEGDRIPEGLSIPSWVAVSGQHGRLYSDTVRRAGVVSNLDALPTLQRLALGRYDRDLPGRPIWGSAKATARTRRGLPSHLADAVQLQDALRTMALATLPTLGFLGFAGVALLLSAAVLLWPRKGRGAAPALARRFVQQALVALLLAPAGVLMAAGRTPGNTAAFAVYAILATGALYVAVWLAGRLLADSREELMPATLQMACGAVVAVVAVNAMRHGRGMVLSPFSNSYLTGVRFYGLGNEYAALYIACVVLFGLLAAQRAGAESFRTGGLSLLGAWFLTALFPVGWPAHGANAGGMLAGFACCGSAWALAARRSGVRFAWAYPVVVAALALAAILWADARSPHATHMGRFAREMAGGGEGPAALLLSKLAIFGKVLGSGWILLALAFGATCFLLLRGPLAPAARRVNERWPWVSLALPAAIIGGVIGALVNDSGLIVFGLILGATAVALTPLALEPLGFSIAGGSIQRGGRGVRGGFAEDFDLPQRHEDTTDHEKE